MFKDFEDFRNLQPPSLRGLGLWILEQRELSALRVYALASLVEVFLVQLEAGEVAFLLDASDGGCAAAHTVVEHRVALVGVGENEIAQQVNGLLGGVDAVVVYALTCLAVEVDYHARIIALLSHDDLFV